MQPDQVEFYLRRATDFFHGMQFLQGDEVYRNSTALLAIHSAVSYSDALRVGLGDASLSSDDHRNAAKSLKLALARKHWSDETGLRHLRDLTSRKSEIAYGGKRISDYQAIFDKARKFAAWSNKIGKELEIEGWRNVS
jgi:hypothetical protein